MLSSPIPARPERIAIGGETAWIWSTERGWKILQGPYRVGVENWIRNGQDWHSFEFENVSPRQGGQMFGGSSGCAGHLDKAVFMKIAERIVQDLRKQDAPPIPPAPA